MAAKLVIDGMPPYDGEYELDLDGFISSFTMRELHRIKKLTGLRAGELGDAFDAGDSDLGLAVAVVVLERAGKRVIDDILWNGKPGAIKLVIEPDEEDEDDPPAEASVTTLPTGSGGGGSPSKSGSRGSRRKATGSPSSATPTSDPDSDPETSAA